MKLVKVICRTNLDSHQREVWPRYLYNPKVGDYVMSENRKKLRIVSITHLHNSVTIGSARDGEEFSVLEIELHN